MEKLFYNGNEYDRIFIWGEDYFLKYSPVEIAAWNLFKDKNLSFVNIPKDVYKLNDNEKNNQLFINCKSKIVLPVLKGYKTLDTEQFTCYISDEEFLKLWKRNILLLKEMHNSDIIHGDIYSKNIMINNDLDIQFIDFDALIIENMVSNEHCFDEEHYSIDSIKQYGRYEDKTSLMGMYLSYLCYGKFSSNIVALDNFFSNLHFLGFSEEMEMELISYIIKDKKIIDNYYFEDMVDELIKMGYERKYVKKHNLIH